jgi:uncharacterized membrane-anchored protein
MNQQESSIATHLSKVPQITALFWITKIFATTFGETGGDAVSMSLNLGYLISTFIFAAVFIALLFFQIRSKFYRPYCIGLPSSPVRP